MHAQRTAPPLPLALYGLDGELVDLTLFTLTAEFIDPDDWSLAHNKTAGVFGGNGVGPSNIELTFSDADHAALRPGKVYKLKVRAVNGTTKYVLELDQWGTLLEVETVAAPS